jgi:NitT/TauT family transport system substrate-binding protein
MHGDILKMMKQKRRNLLQALWLAPLMAVGLSAGVWAQSASKLDKMVVAGWSKPITEITNLLVEEDKGFFKARGIELGYVPGAGGGDALRNLLSGQADVAFTDPGSFFAALDKGEKLRAIYDIYPQNVFNVVSLKSQNIRQPADLKGKRIGVYSLSSGTRQNLQVLLHQAGLTESDVTLVVTGLLNFAPLMQGPTGLGRCECDGSEKPPQPFQRFLCGARRNLPTPQGGAQAFSASLQRQHDLDDALA